MAKAKKALSLALAALFVAGSVFSFAPAANAAVAKKVVVNYYNNALANIRAINAELLLNKDLSVVANRVEITKQFVAYKANMAKETNATKKAALVKMFNSVWAAYQKLAAEDIAAAKGQTNVTVTSVVNPADITVSVGAAVTLPTTVEATMSDNSKKQVSVTWNGTVDTTKAGDVTVAGKAEGKDVSVKVSVKAAEVKAESVKAVAADKFEVKFNTAVDTTKVKFDVKRDSSPYTVTATWNTDKTVATLAASSKFPLGSYTVNVKNDATDLGTTTLSIEQEKVAKIDITSDTLGVTSDGKKGYFTYKVYNQYNEDITQSSLASLSWTFPGATPVETSNDSKGVMVADVTGSGISSLLNLSLVTVTVVDSSSNVVSSKTLKVATMMGTISDIQLVKAYNKEDKEFTAGDSTVKYYIEYTAKDMGGNATDNFALLKEGLVDNNSTPNNDEIKLSTSGYITARVVNEDGKGVIELKTDNQTITTDIPVTITAVTKTGKTSTLNLTLKKQSQVNDIRLMAPTVDVAYGDTKEIPFVAYDANGKQLTKFDDIVAGNAVNGKYTTVKNSAFNLSPLYNGTSGLYFTKRADGTAKLNYKAIDSDATTDTSTVLTATTNTGKFSTVTINIRKGAYANSLAFDSSSLVTRIQAGAKYQIDNSLFTAKDQYGRAMTLKETATPQAGDTKLYIKAVPSSNLITAQNEGTVDKDIVLTAGANKGSNTVTFKLFKATYTNGAWVEEANAIASKTVDFTVIADEDIDGLVASDVKIANTNKLDTTAQSTYNSSIKVYGKTSAGYKVVLKEQTFDINASNADLSRKVNVTAAQGETLDPVDYNKVSVGAVNALAAGVTESSTVVSVTTVINGSVKATTFTVTQNTATPVAQSIDADDEISVGDYAETAVLTDVIAVKDQYGKNMLKRPDGAVSVYVDGVYQGSTFDGDDLDISTLLGAADSKTVTIVAGGMTKDVIIKK